MTHIEQFCAISGHPAPNMDHSNGVHYGVIHSNNLNPDALEDIYSNGEDLTYRDAQEQALAELESAFSDVALPATRETLLAAAMEGIKALGYDARYRTYGQMADAAEAFADTYADDSDWNAKDAAQALWDEGVGDCWNDHYENNRAYDGSTYRYEHDGYVLELCADGDIFVIRSPYYTMAAECSPCAPNAGYITSEGSLKTYCLGPDWFDSDSPMEYTCYRMSDGAVYDAATETWSWATREEAKSLRLTNGMECFTCTVTATDERGSAELMDSNGARYYRDDYNGGWTSDAADELVTVIREGESDEGAKMRILAEAEDK